MALDPRIKEALEGTLSSAGQPRDVANRLIKLLDTLSETGLEGADREDLGRRIDEVLEKVKVHIPGADSTTLEDLEELLEDAASADPDDQQDEEQDDE